MPSCRLLFTAIALLTFSLQGLAAPLSLECAHPSEQSSTQAHNADHKHHTAHLDKPDPSKQSKSNCNTGCLCTGDCVHAGQLSFAQPQLFVLDEPTNTRQITSLNGSPHHAYQHPLLRPPAKL
ncbi:MAG: hypothetical protein R3352_06080 [Salinisphaeraceae bacterium]|nr:hypothetical protein [Salinisphaeraceae bacterium]